MIYRELNTWIAQSESWQAFVDYNLTEQQIANYAFLNRSDDFYIALLSKLYDLLEDLKIQESQELKNDIVSIAKGLEVYSLEVKRDRFQGVNFKRNLLYIASLYYLADFPATSFFLLKRFAQNDFETELEKFLFFFLSRRGQASDFKSNSFFSFLFLFLKDGNTETLVRTIDRVDGLLSDPSDLARHEFIPLLLSRAILEKFQRNNLWFDLLQYGEVERWKKYIRYNLYKTPSVWNFFPSQREAILKGLFSFESAFSLQTPTSSGKTTIAELIIYNEFIKDPTIKVLYLSPFRALASELKQNLGYNLSRLGIKIKAIYGGASISDVEKNSFENATVLISTPEKFLAVENVLHETLDQYRLVICDEGHLIDDATRGISYELLLSRLKNNPKVKRRFLFLSAIIPNIETINQWLGGREDQVVYSTYRPTQLELGFLASNGSFDHNLTINPFEDFPKKYILNNVLRKEDFQAANGKYIAPNTFTKKAVAIALKSLPTGVVALFVPQKGDKEGINSYSKTILAFLSLKLPQPLDYANHDCVSKLLEYFKVVFGADYLLSKCIEAGFLYHHGDLPQFIREIIETELRKENIKFFLCTSTLAEGVNLPIKTLVVSSVSRFNYYLSRREPMEARDLKNLIGRAGRAGKERKGMIIVANPNDIRFVDNVLRETNIEKVNGYLYHVVKAIQSYIRRKSLMISNELLDELEQSEIIDTSIIQLLSEDVSVNDLKETVSKIVSETLTYYQSNQDDEVKSLLLQIFNLRSEKIKPFIENKRIGLLKNSGLSVRMFETFESNLNFKDEILSEINNPVDERWIDFLLGSLFSSSTFSSKLPQINSEKISKDTLKHLVIRWMTGAWYHELSEDLNIPIDRVLKILNSFISFEFQIAASGFIRYIEAKRLEEGLPTAQAVSEWTNYLNYGVSSKTALNLLEIGAIDRVGVQIVAGWLDLNEINYDYINELKSILYQNRSVIESLLSQNVPLMSVLCFKLFIQRYHEN